jgi:hypothetical protein
MQFFDDFTSLNSLYKILFVMFKVDEYQNNIFVEVGI